MKKGKKNEKAVEKSGMGGKERKRYGKGKE